MISIAIEFPTYQIKAVRCWAPTALSDVSCLLANYTHTLHVFDVVDSGDILLLAPTVQAIRRIAHPDFPIIRKEGRKKYKQDHPYTLHNNRDFFVTWHQAEADYLFLWSVVKEQWLYFDMAVPEKGWRGCPLTPPVPV